MKLSRCFTRRRMIILCSVIVTAVLSVQLVAATVWTADFANAGPGVTIVQLSQDSDSDWATNDLIERLSEFIHDDPFFSDRISVIKTNSPLVVESITDNVIIYVSHGGPLGIVTGKYLTSWNRMADIIDNSESPIHLFTACFSKNIIRHGSADSTKQLYTVPEARPAEVTNVEIVTTVMLAFGMDPETVSNYRNTELKEAKELVESGESVHIMDFEQIILNEIDNIDSTYSDTYTSDFKVYREAIMITYTNKYDFYLLHSDVIDLIMDYFRWYVDSDGVDMSRDVSAIRIDYTKNYYIESTWISDPPPDPEPDPEPGPGPWPEPDPYPIGPESLVYMEALYVTGGHWENSTPVFTGGTYSGTVIFPGDGAIYTLVVLNVTASGPTLDASGKTEVDSISLNQQDAGGTYIQQQKIDGVWQEPIVGRNPKRTGGSWTDSAIKADYEYDPTWPVFPETSAAVGDIHSSGEYIYVDSIPTGTGWHGPSFVRTLPSYFKMNDMGCISANLSLFHGNDASNLRILAVSLCDEDMNIAMVLRIVDSHGSLQRGRISAFYYLEDGTSAAYYSEFVYDEDICGIAQLRFEPTMGVYADVPGKDPYRLFTWTQINTERLIKYVAIQSCRYSYYPLNDARIHSIQLTYAGSEYTVFDDNCNDMDDFNDDTSFAYGSVTDGTIEVPDGQSYMTLSSVATGISWHGPNYVHVLDRPFRLFQLSEFSVLAEIVQGASSSMGKTGVALYDDNKQCIMTVEWADDDNWGTEGWLQTRFYPQNGGEDNRLLWYGDSSLLSEVRLWWADAQDGKGFIMVHSDNFPYDLIVGGCDNASRIVKYVIVMGQGYSSNPLLDMRIHDIFVESDIKRHVLQIPEPVKADGTGSAMSESPISEDFVNDYESQARQALSTIWLAPWPAVQFTCSMILSGLIFGLVLIVDILGSLTVDNLELSHSALSAMSDEELEASAGKILGLSPVKFYSAVALTALISAQFFATFGLLPAAKALFTISIIAYVSASIMLIISMVQSYFDGNLTSEDAFVGILTLVIGIIFGGPAISKQSFFGRVFTCLHKYRVDCLPEWGYHDMFLLGARLLLLLLGIAVAFGIYCRGLLE